MTPTETPAGLWRRLVARATDLITMLWLAGFVLIEIDQRLLGGDPFGERPLAIDVQSPRTVALVALVIVGYEVVPTRVYGATFGKALAGLRVRPVGGRGVVTVPLASVRAIVLYGAPVAFGAFGGVVLLVLVASVVIPASGRGLHDRAAATQVVSLASDEE